MRHECLKCKHNAVCMYQKDFDALKAQVKDTIETDRTPFSAEVFCNHFFAEEHQLYTGTIYKHPSDASGRSTISTSDPSVISQIFSGQEGDDKWEVDEVGDIGLSTGADYLDKKDEEEGEK